MVGQIRGWLVLAPGELVPSSLGKSKALEIENRSALGR